MKHRLREAIASGGILRASEVVSRQETRLSAGDPGTVWRPADLIFEQSGQRDLNGFFAFSMNSPSMSMVNFSCFVCCAPRSTAPGVPRRVTPQPVVAAVRMEAG